jgi:hypothetical protein
MMTIPKRYGTQQLFHAAKNGNLEAELLTSALMMLGNASPIYKTLSPAELVSVLLRFHRGRMKDEADKTDKTDKTP